MLYKKVYALISESRILITLLLLALSPLTYAEDSILSLPSISSEEAKDTEGGKSSEVSIPERISVSYCIDCVPFHFQDDDLKPAGMMIDLWRLWSNKTGVKIDFVPASWNQTIEQVKTGKSQVHAGLFFSKERSRFLTFGAKLSNTDTHVFLHRDLPSINNLVDLSGYRIGVLKGDYVEGYLKKRLPIESVIAFSSYAKILDALNMGTIRAFAADTLTGIYYLNKSRLLTDYKISTTSLLYDNDWNIAVKYGNHQLREIIDKGMKKISNDERDTITARWESIVSADDEVTVMAVQGENDEPAFSYSQGIGLLKNLSIIFFSLLLIVAAYWIYLGRPKQLTIRQILFVTFLIFSVSVTAISGLIALLWEGEQKEFEIKNLEYASFELALELKQSSDDLTRMARLYTIRGDASFERYFKHIIAIRDGKQARPGNYIRTYWDHILAGSIKHNANGPTYSLEQKMLDLRFSDKERLYIASAKKKSDELVVMETIAMNAAKGVFQDSEGNFTQHNRPNLELARNMLHSREYHNIKSDILEEIDLFFEQFKFRMATDLHDINAQNIAILGLITLLTVFTIAFSIFSYFYLKSRIIKPLSMLEEGSEAIRKGDYYKRIDLVTNDEVGALAKTFNSMAESILLHTEDLRKVVQAIEQSPLSVMITNIEGVIEHVNPAFSMITGFSSNEAIGKRPNILSSDRVARYVYEDLWLTIQNGDIYHSEIQNKRKNGELFWASISIAPVNDNNDQVTHFIGMMEDISIAKSVEFALNEAEQTRQLALDAAQIGLWRGDIKKNVWTWDSRVNRMMGLSDAIVLNVSNKEPISQGLNQWFDMLHPDDRENTKAELYLAINNRKPYNVEYRVVWPNGATRYIAARGKTSYNDEGETTYIDGVTYDITDLRSAEQAVKSAQERFELAVRGSGDALWEYDTATETYWFSPRFSELLGYKADELPHTSEILQQHMHPDDFETANQGFNAHLSTASVYDVEYRMRTKQGNYHWFRARAKSKRDKQGLAYLTSGSVSDITARKEAELALSENKELLRAVLDNSPAVIYMKDLEGRYLLVNKIFCNVVGKNSEMIIGHTDYDFQPEEVVEHFVLNDRVVAESGESLQREEKLQQPDGTFHTYMSYKFPVLNSEGEVFAVGGVSTNITDLILAKEAAEDATKVKSDFLANMSHEIRTPMNAIIGMSYLALQTDLNRQQTNYIEKVHRSAEALLGIINDILDFSKIEAGKMELEEIDFLLEEVFENLANLVGLKAEDKGLELLFDIPADLPTALIGDPLRLGQILVNLGNNAVKFTDTGEVLVRVRAESKNNHEIILHFSVCDTGIGLSQTQQEKLFSSFSQADTSTTRKFGGTGLGLTISKRFTDMMGGEIWVESEEGAGSEFHFTAIFKEQKNVKPLRESIITDNEPVKILIVDNNDSAREIFESMLTVFGFDTVAVASGEDALDALNESDFNLILLDWKMPGMDGIETAQSIYNLNLHSPPKIILVTAHGRDEAIKASLDIDVSCVMTKPLTPSSLLDAIMIAMGKEIAEVSRASRSKNDAREAISSLQGAKILLVEDNDINQELAQELLQNNGLSVVVANDGQQALDILDNEEFDGILMDCQMPVMDGYTATKKIRAQNKYKSLPILAMTANAMAGDREKVLEVGMNDHIAKPINVSGMFIVMAKWITPSTDNNLDEITHHKKPESSGEQLPKIEGINTNIGLAVTQENISLYRKLLIKFYHSQKDFEVVFNEALLDVEESSSARVAHTLKGVAGSLGVSSVATAAGALESACENQQKEDEVHLLLCVLLDALSPVISGLEQWLNASTEVSISEAGELDVGQLTVLIARLKGFLEENDTESTELVDQILALPGVSIYSDTLKKVTNAVEEYDFDEALDQLKTFDLQQEK